MTAGTALPRPMVEPVAQVEVAPAEPAPAEPVATASAVSVAGRTATAGTDRVPPAAVLQEEPVPAPQQALRVEPVEQQERVLLVDRRLDQLDQQR